MKKISMALCLLSSLSLYAQKFSIDFGGGYSQGLSGLTTYSETEMVEGGVYSEKLEFMPVSFSAGWIGRLGFTAQLNDQMFLSFAARYRNAGEKEYVFYTGSDQQGSLTYNAQESIFIKHNNIELQFGLGVQRNIGDRLSLSMSAGPSVGVYGRTQYRLYEMEQYGDPSGVTEVESEDIIELTPYLQIGGYTDVALNFKLSDKLALFGNATLRLQTWSPKSSKITSTKYNGEEGVDQLSVYQAETEYESNVQNNFVQPDPSQPSKQNREWYPASSAEFVIGLRYSLGAAPKAAPASSGKKGMYLAVLGGYGLALGGGTTYESDNNSTTTKMYSNGGGIHFGLNGGYAFGNGISLDLGAVFNRASSETEFGNSSNPVTFNTVSTMIRLQTGIKIESDANRFNPFVRAGITTGIGTKIVSTRESTNSKRVNELTGGLSLGGYGGLGVSYKVSPKISLIAQGTVFVQSWSPSLFTRTESTSNGIDQLAGESTYFLETEYVDEITYSQNDPTPSQDEPRKAIKSTDPFSAAVFSLGVRFTFGK